MAINFAAANMAGYNNPELMFITIKLDSQGKPIIKPPTYEDISGILKRGVVPFLALTDAYNEGTLLSLSLISSKVLTFSCVTQTTDGPQNSMVFNSIKFVPNADPIFKSITFSAK